MWGILSHCFPSRLRGFFWVLVLAWLGKMMEDNVNNFSEEDQDAYFSPPHGWMMVIPLGMLLLLPRETICLWVGLKASSRRRSRIALPGGLDGKREKKEKAAINALLTGDEKERERKVANISSAIQTRLYIRTWYLEVVGKNVEVVLLLMSRVLPV